MRFNYNNRYFKDTWEGLPADGYTAWLERMIDDPRITVKLETDFFDETQPLNKRALLEAGVPVVYTGPVDRYFDYDLGELKWRTVDLKEVRYDEGDHFGCAVMNFSDADVPYTRAIEFKNFNPSVPPSRTRTRPWCGRNTRASRTATTSRITRSTPMKTRPCMHSTRRRPPTSRMWCSEAAWAPTRTTTWAPGVQPGADFLREAG